MATINLVMHIMIPILTLIAGLFIGICIGVYILGPMAAKSAVDQIMSDPDIHRGYRHD
jgi:uncharacterized protein YneF (UPF0154 family)